MSALDSGRFFVGFEVSDLAGVQLGRILGFRSRMLSKCRLGRGSGPAGVGMAGFGWCGARGCGARCGPCPLCRLGCRSLGCPFLTRGIWDKDFKLNFL